MLPATLVGSSYTGRPWISQAAQTL